MKTNKLYIVFFDGWEIFEAPHFFTDESAAKEYAARGVNKLLEYHDLEVFDCETKEEFLDEIILRRNFKDFIQYNYTEIEDNDIVAAANYLLSLLEY